MIDEFPTFGATPIQTPKPVTSSGPATKPVVPADFDDSTKVGVLIPGHIPSAQRLAQPEMTTLNEFQGMLTPFISILYHRMRAIVVRHLPIKELTEERLSKPKDFFFDNHQLDHVDLSLQTAISSNPNWQYLNDDDVLRALINKPYLHLARGVGSNLNWQYLNHADVSKAVFNNLNKELALGVASNPNWQGLNSDGIWQTVSKNIDSLFARGIGSNINWNLLNDSRVQIKVLTNQNTEFAAGVGSNPNWLNLNSDSTLIAVINEQDTKFAEAIGANPYWQHLNDSRIKKGSKLARAVESNPKKLLTSRFDENYLRRIKLALAKIPEPQNHPIYKVLEDSGVNPILVA